MKARLELHFSNPAKPQLFRTRVLHPRLQEERLCVRGKSAGAHYGAGSFQWSAAVKAFSILACRSAAEKKRGVSLSPLIGKAGSPSASLDYSLSKNTQWLIDVFGKNSSGEPLWPAFFRRTNPNQKRQGPVAVSLSAAFADDSQSIVIYWDRKQLSSDIELFNLATLLEDDWYRSRRVSNIADYDSRDLLSSSLINRIDKALELEVFSSLSSTDIFTSRGYREAIDLINQSNVFVRIAGGVSPVHEIDSKLCESRRLGLFSEFKTKYQLQAAIPAPMPAANAIFTHIDSTTPLKVKIDKHYVHAVDLAARIINRETKANSYDLLCLGIAPAASLLVHRSKTDYQPFMLLPKVSQRIVASANASQKALESGDYLMIKDEPSIPSFLYDELAEEGMIDGRKSKKIHMEPDGVFSELLRGESNKRAILFFPHYCFNQWLNGCGFIKDPRKTITNQDCILFVHKRYMSDKEFLVQLSTLVRNSWIELKSSAEVRARTISKMNLEGEYSRLLARCGGIHNLAA